MLSDVAQVNAEKQSLEQEITSLRLQLERAERQAKVESSRLNAEIQSLRQRLDRSDSDLLHSRRENLRLSDSVANLDKEVNLEINMKKKQHDWVFCSIKCFFDCVVQTVLLQFLIFSFICSQLTLGDINRETRPSKELTKLMSDMEAKHGI